MLPILALLTAVMLVLVLLLTSAAAATFTSLLLASAVLGSRFALGSAATFSTVRIGRLSPPPTLGTLSRTLSGVALYRL